MILISVQELQKSFGVHEVLRSVTFSLQKGEKMGLVGVNGCGKTTLMRMIAGEMQPDGGTIHRNKDLRVGYLAQLDDIPLTDTVWGALLKVFEPIRVMERRMAEIEKLLESADPETALRLSSEYQRLTESYNAQQGYAYEGEMLRVLNGLGLKPEMHQRQVSTLSGGERTRLSLAKLLLQKPDIILPTIWIWKPSNGYRTISPIIKAPFCLSATTAIFWITSAPPWANCWAAR